MSLRHIENIGRVTEGRLNAGPKYASVEIDYVTAGGIQKTLKIAHGEAEQIRALIGEALDVMPERVRKGSFFASLKRNR
jgi:hypothetical protein